VSDVHVQLRPGDRLIVEYVDEPKRPTLADAFLTLDQLPVSARVARAMIQRGELPATKKGRAYLVRRADVDRVFAPKNLAANVDEFDAAILAQLKERHAR
jgi:excisionase family DNA binding protein